ncbi:phage portal protein [Tsukamurella asaccharolytica]|uniref:Phage portal protein n=1 Tax=Tsukamurella asaccharolytica TaxID=2592067 RepID=A0A5C5RFC0_9ACTN|nr:phage portal protein [Tsukamurella asaccharolytica]TWS20785.1 phage portal protein [Tsukamurella asaccharolytica]
MTDPFVPLTAVDELSDAENTTLGKLRAQLERVRPANEGKYKLYEGKHKARNLDIAVPPHLAELDVFVGVPGTVVDVLAERIEWDNWISTAPKGELYGLDEIYRDNALDVEQSRETVDALICGTGFVAVGSGNEDADEPPVLITAESPMEATTLWDPRRRVQSSGLVQRHDPDCPTTVTAETLYLENSTITMTRRDDGTLEVERDDHHLGIVPLVPFPNRERPSDIRGRSEITGPVRYLTEAIGRTLLGMEINREFYTAPQRYGLGVDPEQFGIKEDSPRGEVLRKQWQVAMSRMNFIPGPENPGDPMPQVGQFSPAPPTPYIDQVKHYMQHVSAEGAIPWNYLGFQTDNPPSADAVRVMESRLIKRALLRQRMWTRAWRQVALLALLHKDPHFDRALAAQISPNWLDPTTPTPAAQADATTKLVQSEILPKDSKVTYRRLGLSEAEQTELEAEKRTSTSSTIIDKLLGTPPAAVPPSPDGAAQQIPADRQPPVPAPAAQQVVPSGAGGR